MKKILYLFSIFLGVSVLYPQTYYLNVNLKSGTRVTYVVADITRIDFSDITRLEEAQKLSQMIKSFKVLQNYPNPFNLSTTIEYQIPKAGNVQILIFDINDRLVKTIENQNHTAGSYNVMWDGQNERGVKVASGLFQ